MAYQTFKLLTCMVLSLRKQSLPTPSGRVVSMSVFCGNEDETRWVFAGRPHSLGYIRSYHGAVCIFDSIWPLPNDAVMS
ncbi:hypothetical protein K440DRAFT_626124 [Wilcoxina mikolae CBS 423.85]|nr:hypothetical protein K440DRAFT_626124 [Wilcoxina mikolae CBS 423.85]